MSARTEPFVLDAGQVKSAFSDNVKSEVYEERLQNIGFLAHELNRTPTAIHCVFTTSTFLYCIYFSFSYIYFISVCSYKRGSYASVFVLLIGSRVACVPADS
jgi:hypothetical protein